MDKYAVVSGADRGLGLELAKGLVNNGYIVFAGKYLEEWTDLTEASALYPDRLIPLSLDVGSTDSVRQAVQEVKARTGKVDILLNNAAAVERANSGKTITEPLDFTVMSHVFNVTALGALRVASEFMPLLLQGKDKLIANISSEAGSIGQSWRSSGYSYCMGKAALNMHTTITYNSIRELGGHVLNLHPGWVQGWLGGKHNIEADLTPEFSAEHLMRIIMRYRTYQTNQPAYLNYLGDKLVW